MYSLFHFVALFAVLFLPFQVLAAPHAAVAKARRTVDLSAEDIATFLDAHNSAAFWAGLCLFKHSDGLLQSSQYGEIIVAATGNFPITAAVGTFLADQDKYSPVRPRYTHWTQVVWKSTTRLGCATALCEDALDVQYPQTLYVCLYNPAGNVVGQALCVLIPDDPANPFSPAASSKYNFGSTAHIPFKSSARREERHAPSAS